MGYSELNLQRRTEIENELLQLMKEQPFNSITVKDLTQRLEISRKTFYSYFPNKHVCLDSLTDRLICECNLDILKTSSAKPDFPRLFRTWSEFWIQNRDFLDVMIANQMGDYFADRLIAYVRQESPTYFTQMQSPQLSMDEDILYFYIHGQVALLLKWCRDGFSLPVEEMARKQTRLAEQPIFLSENE